MVNRRSSLMMLGLALTFASGCPEPDERGDWGDWYEETGETGDDSSDDGGVETGADERQPVDTGGDGDGDGDGDPGDGDGDGDGGGDDDDPMQCLDRLLADGTLPAVIFDNTIGRNDDSLGSCGIGAAPDFQVGFVAPWAGSYTFDSSGSSFDTVVYVHEGECGDEELGCNDDFIGLESRLTLELEQDQAVTVSVDGTSPFEEGPLELRITEAAPPSCNALKITANLPQQIFGDTSGNADQLHSGCGGDGAPEQVYSFTAPGPGTYRFDTSGSSFDTVLYTLDECDEAPLSCNDDFNFQLHSRLDVDLAGGQRLLVVVDGHDDDDDGDFVLSVEEL